MKLLAILEYNKGKYSIDYSDQIVSYTTTIEKESNGIENLIFILIIYKIETRKEKCKY